MKGEVIDFNLDSAIIKMISEVKIELLHCCQDVDIYLLKNNKKYLLGVDTLRENIFVLKNALKKTLHNQLQLHPSITQDIGILWNEELQDKPGLTYEKLEKRDYWVGLNYLLWNANHLATWLYNDANGNIILHITPTYENHWTGEDDEEETNDRACQEWMATKYAPLWTTKLSPETAKVWLAQAEDVFNRLKYTEGYVEKQNEN